MSRLYHLRRLDLASNPIRSLPPSILALPALYELDLTATMLRNAPSRKYKGRRLGSLRTA